MGQKLLIGAPGNRGLQTDKTAFNIDNDSFPMLQNAYQWRGRVKRKRGTAFLCRLTRYFGSDSASYFASPHTLQLDGSGAANIISFYGLSVGSTLQPGSIVVISFTNSYAITGITSAIPAVITATTPFAIGQTVYIQQVGGKTYLNNNLYIVTANGGATLTIDADATLLIYTPGTGLVSTVYLDNGNGKFTLNGSIVSGSSINYVTGEIVIPPEANNFVDIHTNYYLNLPVMGLEDFDNAKVDLLQTISFDTKKSYNISTASVPTISRDVTWYKNVPSNSYTNGSTPNVAKNRLTSFGWQGQDYQQFWTTNYQGALFTTNGISIPLDITKIGMSFVRPTIITWNSATQMTFVIPVSSGLRDNDFLMANEFTSGTPGNEIFINLQTGYITSFSDAGADRTIVVIFPYSSIPNDTYAGGILQLLTKQVNSSLDCIRWYDGDPTGGTYPPVTTPGLGWVNFQPPLSLAPYSIADQPAAIYYLVGARMIYPFRDRLIFIGPVIQTSVTDAAPIYLQDTVIYSQNGTPYYTAGFVGDPVLASTIFTPIITPGRPIATDPANQIASPMAFICDQPGFGGWAQVGISQKINTCSLNENVLILGMDTHQVRMVYTSNDLNPFNFYFINSELGSSSTFSAINMDKGVLSRGSRGFVVCSQVETQRFDLDIPDEVYQINTLNNGIERVCSIRDFINEWVQFTYNNDADAGSFPNYTLQYNYRDRSWATIYESYTTYGNFRVSEVISWATLPYSSWGDWNDPWNAGASNEGQPLVIGGNQQGFVLVKGEGEGTAEGTSLAITAFTGNIVTSPNHGLASDDFIKISGVIGTMGSFVNNFTFQIAVSDIDNFTIEPLYQTGTYLGGGVITRLYIPDIRTKQFPLAWDMARKTRIGPSMYLLTKTDNAQMTLLIYLSQISAFASNVFPPNDALIYSTVLYTSPESTNLGLTPANTNLQMVTASNQEQVWHRVSESLIGDTVQLGFTVSPDQMLQIDPVANTTFAITGATNAYPCVLTCTAGYAADALIKITGVNGMTDLNFMPTVNNYYSVISSDGTIVTINIDSTGFGIFTSSPNAIATQYDYTNQETEIEIHGIIIDANPSMLLS